MCGVVAFAVITTVPAGSCFLTIIVPCEMSGVCNKIVSLQYRPYVCFLPIFPAKTAVSGNCVISDAQRRFKMVCDEVASVSNILLYRRCS